jgi:hypothetical protein
MYLFVFEKTIIDGVFRQPVVAAQSGGGGGGRFASS